MGGPVARLAASPTEGSVVPEVLESAPLDAPILQPLAPAPPLDPLRQAAWRQPDPVLARLARLMTLESSRPVSPVLSMQDRGGPVTGCLEALRSSSTRSEALSRLPQALGSEPPRLDVRWAVGRLAREGDPGALSLLHRWSQEVPATPEPCPPDPQRDLAVAESWNMTGGWMPPIDQIPEMIEGCARRASPADLAFLAMLCWRTPHPDHAAWKKALSDQLPAVTGAVSAGLSQGHDHAGNPEPALTLLNHLRKEFPEACGPDWVKGHLAPALRTLPERDEITPALFDQFPVDAGRALLGEVMQERPSGLSGWRLELLGALHENHEFMPTPGEARWLSQWLLPRPLPDIDDRAAEAISVKLLARFGDAHPQEFAKLQLPDRALNTRPLPEAYLERLLHRPAGHADHLASVSRELGRVALLSPERRAELADQLAADFAAGRSLEGDVRLPLLDCDLGAQRDLASRLLPGLAERQPGEESNQVFRSQLEGLRRAWLEGEVSDVSASDRSLRHAAALHSAPGHWMALLKPALGGWAQELEAGGEAPQAIERAQVALGRQGKLNGTEMLDVAVAVLLCQANPPRLLDVLERIPPAYLATISVPPLSSGSAQDFALSSIACELRDQIGQAPELVSHCRDLTQSAALLNHAAALNQSGQEATRQAVVERSREKGPPEAAALVAELDRQGVLREGLSAFTSCTPELERHANLALGLLQKSTRSESGERIEEASGAFREVLSLIGEGHTEESALQVVLARSLGMTTGGTAVDLDGPRPSVGGILLRRRRSS